MKNKTKKILIIILIITIIITIINVVSNNKNNINEAEEFIPLEPETVIPQNSYLFFGKYVNGEVTSKQFYETITNFYKVTFPNYYYSIKNKDISQLKEYYNLNKQQIRNDMIIENEKEFLQFSGIVSKLKTEALSLESLEIKEGTIIERTDYTICEINVKYLDNNEISMNIKVFKKYQDNGKNIEFSINEK